MKKRLLNVKLLRKIQKHITEEPRRFFMSGIAIHAKNKKDWDQARFWRGDLANTMPACKTAACIAGWALELTDNRHEDLPYAARLLGIDPLKMDNLFLSYCWPKPFRSAFEKSRSSPKTRAKAACDRIDHLIKTGK